MINFYNFNICVDHAQSTIEFEYTIDGNLFEFIQKIENLFNVSFETCNSSYIHLFIELKLKSNQDHLNLNSSNEKNYNIKEGEFKYNLTLKTKQLSKNDSFLSFFLSKLFHSNHLERNNKNGTFIIVKRKFLVKSISQTLSISSLISQGFLFDFMEMPYEKFVKLFQKIFKILSPYKAITKVGASHPPQSHYQYIFVEYSGSELEGKEIEKMLYEFRSEKRIFKIFNPSFDIESNDFLSFITTEAFSN